MAQAWRGGELPAATATTAASASRSRATGRPSRRSASGRTSRTCGAPGPAARRARALGARAGAGPAHRHRAGEGAARRARRASRRPTCRATAGTACSTTTGPASSPRARRCAASATCSPPWRPTTRARRARRRRWSRSSTRCCPPVLDPEAALAAGAPQVNPTHPNLLSRSVIRRGDVAAALAASAHVVSGTWRTQRIEHLFLEPEAALAEPLAGGRLALYTQGQGVFDDRRQVARFLGLPEERVHVELAPSGGAFGGKEDMSVQAQTALLAFVTGRPVKLVLDREESIRLHPKRHPIRIDYTVGCDAAGRLTAVVARLLGDSGAYASVGGKVLERAAGHACGPYRVPAPWTSRRSPPTPTTRPAARCAASACPRRPSPSRAASTCSRRRSGSTAGRCAAATPSASATRSPPARCSRSRWACAGRSTP